VHSDGIFLVGYIVNYSGESIGGDSLNVTLIGGTPQSGTAGIAMLC